MADIIRRGKKIEIPDKRVNSFNYWDDARWAEVKRLRKSGDPGDIAKAAELEDRIKKHWKVEK